MACDRLQFRGYPGYEVPSVPLADREIMFDLTADTLVIGRNKTYLLTEGTGYTRVQIDQFFADADGGQGPQGIEGPQGVTGPQGPIGPQGEAGPEGPQGPRGYRGYTGSMGDIGPQGAQGIPGTGIYLRGTIDEVGPPSFDGLEDGDVIIDSNGDGWAWGGSWVNVGPIRGPQGAIGPEGIQGPAGDAGEIGPRGEQGERGFVGPQGIQGVQGLQGVVGPQGSRGNQGDRGPIGETGEDGTGVRIVGTIDSNGPPNFSGSSVGDIYIDTSDDGWSWNGSGWSNVGPIRGPKGETGAEGPRGVVGPQGVRGPTGSTGAQGAQGIEGARGERGPQGPQGPPGRDGTGSGGPEVYVRSIKAGANLFVEGAELQNGYVQGDVVVGQVVAPGSYSITDEIFGGPVTTPPTQITDSEGVRRNRSQRCEQIGGVWYWKTSENLGPLPEGVHKYEDWSYALNKALSGFDRSDGNAHNNADFWDLNTHNNNDQAARDRTGNFYNGMINTLLIPDGTYDCYNAVVRTRVVRIQGVNGRPTLKFMSKSGLDYSDIEDDENADLGNKDWIWSVRSKQINTDGLVESGQFVLANKGQLDNIRIEGRQGSKSTGDFSTVLAFRFFTNEGVPFNQYPNHNANKKQNDAADMDTGFVDCSFAGKGDGTSGGNPNSSQFCRNGLLKYVGRNAYIHRCAFNHNKSAIVLTFPPTPGSSIPGVSFDTACSTNNSAWNKSQGGQYGWRRCQILDCFFHMNRQAQCISVYGHYQISGMIIADNLADIGGQLLEVCGLPSLPGAYSNHPNGGMKNCTITGNSFANYDKSGSETSDAGEGGALINFICGRFDNISITGNSLYGSDFAGFSNNACNTAVRDNSKAKRPRYHILIEDQETTSGNTVGTTWVNGLTITGNNLGYSSDSSIRVENGVQCHGLSVTGNTFTGIGSGVVRSDTRAANPYSPNSSSVCVDTGSGARGVFVGNTLTQTFSGGANKFAKSSSIIKIPADSNDIVTLNLDNDAIKNAEDCIRI